MGYIFVFDLDETIAKFTGGLKSGYGWIYNPNILAILQNLNYAASKGNSCVDGIFLYTNAKREYADQFVIDLQKKIPGFEFDSTLAMNDIARNATTRITMKKDMNDVNTLIRNSKRSMPVDQLRDRVVFFDDRSDHHLSKKSRFIHIRNWYYTRYGEFRDETDYSLVKSMFSKCKIPIPDFKGTVEYAPNNTPANYFPVSGPRAPIESGMGLEGGSKLGDSKLLKRKTRSKRRRSKKIEPRGS
jgi:hypothetical protein